MTFFRIVVDKIVIEQYEIESFYSQQIHAEREMTNLLYQQKHHTIDELAVSESSRWMH